MFDLDPEACYRAILTRDPRFDGRIFVGVRTTGVYCRPVCPAVTPKQRNVSFYPSAAAAEAAGFRACLRCRPETAPRTGAWNGTASTVNRALAMIEAGALDDRGVDDLAARLGVGERQLRRLFAQHLGVSPVEVAQTRRVHLAKQLIQETRLPMAEIAFAAGFGSVRRFNETFQSLYSRPPASLRRLKKPPRDEAVRVRLRYREPYDFEGLLDFLGPRAIAGVETVEKGVWRRTIGLGGEAGTIAVRRAGADQLSVEVRFARLTALPDILARVRNVFDLGADPAAINADLGRDPVLAPLVARRPGLRVPGAWDGFELAIRAVLGQQITVASAVKLAGRIAAEYGEPLPDALRRPGLSAIFPTAERLAAADLSGLPMPRARSRALEGIARAAVEDHALFRPGASLSDAVRRLKGLPGVGEWTAQYIAMRALREPDAFPAADIGLMRALATPDGVRPNPAQMLTRAEAWRPWRAYAALHLWAADCEIQENPDAQAA
jgi:AraC family transcriptional regulator of adaptative response / DNA-3-methyladenine glycosylase II